MTVSAETPIASSVANGVTTVFPYTFTVLEDTDLVVQGVLAGITTTYTLGVHYTVSGLGTPSGSVTFLSPPANLTVITRFRNSAIVRDTDYQDNGDLPADTLNLDFDRIWLALQELLAGIQGAMTAVRAPNGETIPPLSSAADRANKALTFDALGNPVAVTPIAGSAAAVLTQLGNFLSNLEGPALVAFNNALTYPANTVGSTLKSLLAGNFASLNNTGNSTLGDNLADILNVAASTIQTDGAGRTGFGLVPSGAYRVEVSGLLGAGAFVATGSTVPTNGMYLPAANTVGLATNSGLKVTIDSAGLVNLVAGPGSLRVGGLPTVFENLTTAVPTSAGAAAIVIPHGLGGFPSQYSVRLKCVIAEHGYAVGDEVELVNVAGTVTYQTSANATNIYFRMPSSSTGLPAIYVFSGANTISAVTAANWRLAARAVRL